MTSVAAKLDLFARDIKVSHTVFALPYAIFAAFLAARGLPPMGVLLLILACMVCARTIAMAANRLLDARVDALNPRTKRRAIPAGKLSRGFYFGMVAACMAGFVAATWGFYALYANPWPLVFAAPVLAFLSGYPLMKRYTRLCHYYLGLGLGLAPLCAWVATAGSVAWPPVLLCLAVLLWTAGFDILYACQDYESDLETGTISVPAKVGIARAFWIARATHLAAWCLLLAVWLVSPQLHAIFAAGITIAAILLIYEHSLVKANDLSKMNMAFFTLNGIISVIVGSSGVLSVLLGK
jgi:4-hydroxybenzoate polyprenyltransferase